MRLIKKKKAEILHKRNIPKKQGLYSLRQFRWLPDSRKIETLDSLVYRNKFGGQNLKRGVVGAEFIRNETY